ncbi:uncharacterized protein E0L32_009397 [Thyridium curvatum]|uniref:Uncharacterized protein n=1 Tax=Thyridium curvatum TaxID=1093900 RepID=A0A507ANM5_9PEZI|nr:uncharacterized protein E0L32_009397 [Thyridium curvatum]TPX09353.1 hypothetical protein E0L32_009397 [Thyridium curvatum]
MRESALPYFLRQYANSTTASAAQCAKDQPAGFESETGKVDIATGSIGKHGTAHVPATGKERPSPPSPAPPTPEDESDTVE